MRIAFLTDIHANREAFEAVLADVAAKQPDRIVLLGDFVGYGADPGWCVDKVMQLVEQGAVAVKGNHDAAVDNERDQMTANAQITLAFTRGELGAPQREFLGKLPLEVFELPLQFVHADASGPANWNYVMDSMDAARSLKSTIARVTFVGHVHRPAIYAISEAGKLTNFVPVTDVAVPLLTQRRWLVVVGSVGQPRDGTPAAAYSIYDTTKHDVISIRVPYDIDTAAAKIRKAGLPEALARRLKTGV